MKPVALQNPKESAEELPRATLSELLERAVPYEQWRAPMDPQLQLLTWLAGAALLVHLLFLVELVPGWLEWSRSDFFLAFQGTFQGFLSWVADHSRWLAPLNLAALVLYLALLWRTRNLQTGTLTWQHVAFGEVAVGAAGAFPLTVSLAIILFNLILWILAIAFFLWILGLALGGE
jgi:hypothetical protein